MKRKMKIIRSSKLNHFGMKQPESDKPRIIHA